MTLQGRTRPGVSPRPSGVPSGRATRREPCKSVARDYPRSSSLVSRMNRRERGGRTEEKDPPSQLLLCVLRPPRYTRREIVSLVAVSRSSLAYYRVDLVR